MYYILIYICIFYAYIHCVYMSHVNSACWTLDLYVRHKESCKVTVGYASVCDLLISFVKLASFWVCVLLS